MMRVLFMGTPFFASACLEALCCSGRFEIVGVVSQPDRPKGRGLVCHPCEVKVMAEQYGLTLWQPERINDPEFLEVFHSQRPDVVAVVAYGQKIPAEILYGPQFGCVNVHGSLLPKYRGAAPIQWSILNGDRETGVTTMYMDEGWDTGDLIYHEAIAINPNEKFCDLYGRLAVLGGKLLVRTLIDIENGTAPRIKQDDAQATLAPKLQPELARIDWASQAASIHNLVRVFSPSPGAETFFGKERLKIIETQIQSAELMKADPTQPGCIIQIIKQQGILVAAGDRPLLITKVQPEGKKMMSALDYANGRRLEPGMILGALD